MLKNTFRNNECEYFSAKAREVAKLAARADALTWMQKNRESDLSIFLNNVQSPQVQAGLDKYLQMLKVKK